MYESVDFLNEFHEKKNGYKDRPQKTTNDI